MNNMYPKKEAIFLHFFYPSPILIFNSEFVSDHIRIGNIFK